MKKIVVAVAMLAAFSAKGASAQTATASTSGTVEQSLFIALDAAGQSVTFANSNAADFNTGYKQAAAGVLTHKGNVTHTVSVKADATTMTASTGGRLDKPAGDVLWSTDGTTFSALSTTAANVALSAAAGEYTKNLNYRMKLGWALDKPATYSLGVTYTIAAN